MLNINLIESVEVTIHTRDGIQFNAEIEVSDLLPEEAKSAAHNLLDQGLKLSKQSLKGE